MRRAISNWVISSSLILWTSGAFARSETVEPRCPAELTGFRNRDLTQGLRIGSLLSVAWPVRLDFLDSADPAGVFRAYAMGYTALQIDGLSAIGVATFAGIRGGPDARIVVRDHWRLKVCEMSLDREVEVVEGGAGGFASEVSLDRFLPRESIVGEVNWYSAYQEFIPGIMYGSLLGLSAKAIGPMGRDALGGQALQMREDRLPIPMAAIRMADGFSFTVLHPKPTGETTKQDSANFIGATSGEPSPAVPLILVDSRFTVGAVKTTRSGAVHSGSRLPESETISLGFVYPAIEAPLTYRGNVYPDAGVAEPRVLLHPLTPGFTQRYSVLWRVSRSSDTPMLVRDSWRWAWAKMDPQVHAQDIDSARRNLIAQLSSQVEEKLGLTGITNFRSATSTQGDLRRDRKTVMGFTGKALETAEYLLWAADAYAEDSAAALYRRQGTAIIDSFVSHLKLDPPTGEGFNMDSGAVAIAIPRNNRVYLRSFGDDVKATLRAYRRERAAGRRHDSWLAWARTFGDWLLTQQRSDGGVPRAWKPGSGQVAEPSELSSFCAVPLWLLLTEITGDRRYEQAAVRAGEFTWVFGAQRFGRFTGGTIDNPNVIDKEAGTLSLEAYLSLFEATHGMRWLRRASAAASFAETWIYAWDVPMPVDDDSDTGDWKSGVPTTGVQLIATGHSLVDEYMSFDVDEFAKLYKYTGDPHNLHVARLLLHDSLAMMAAPGKTYDLQGVGWQQEHWSLAPWRGHGLHRGWLPWVSTSHLNGMIGLDEFDHLLYLQLTR